MSVLIYAEQEQGIFRKQSLEAASYASAWAQAQGTSAEAVVFGNAHSDTLAQYGIRKLHIVNGDQSERFEAHSHAWAIAQIAKESGTKLVVLGASANAQSIAPLLAVHLDAAYVSGVVSMPEASAPMTFTRTVFTNKGFSQTEVSSELAIISLSANAYGVHPNPVSCSSTETNLPELKAQAKTTPGLIDKVQGKISIADAEIVVSAGRGLKGPENWGMIEELAQVLGGATACSKPVSDLGWRPHSEHVGQTGKPVASNLYIAVGISGAIQHLAGVSASKTKVVINTDPEAPFFKAADYGIVGDAFEVVPQLIEKIKAFKSQNA